MLPEGLRNTSKVVSSRTFDELRRGRKKQEVTLKDCL